MPLPRSVVVRWDELMITAADFFAAKLAYEIDPPTSPHAGWTGTPPLSSTSGRNKRGSKGICHTPCTSRTRNWFDGSSTKCPIRHRPRRLLLGPGCNGATKAALTLVQSGYSRVRELIGGFEYWARRAEHRRCHGKDPAFARSADSAHRLTRRPRLDPDACRRNRPRRKPC